MSKSNIIPEAEGVKINKTFLALYLLLSLMNIVIMGVILRSGNPGSFAGLTWFLYATIVLTLLLSLYFINTGNIFGLMIICIVNFVVYETILGYNQRYGYFSNMSTNITVGSHIFQIAITAALLLTVYGMVYYSGTPTEPKALSRLFQKTHQPIYKIPKIQTKPTDADIEAANLVG
jgi:hypothetical protein